MDKSQADVAQRRYYPYGSDRSVSGASDLTRDERYTGQPRVDAGGGNPRCELYSFGARWYLPGVGIFTQPDTIVPEPFSPRALNRYSYAFGNPLMFADPSGHDPIAGQDPDFAYPSNLPSELYDAYRMLWYSGSEGRAKAQYLLQANPVFLVYSGPNAGGFAYTVFGAPTTRVMGINPTGQPTEEVAAMIGHETTHLQQNDAAGNAVVSLEDEIQAYQVQGRIEASLGHPGQWSRSTYQTYTVNDQAARDAVYERGVVYGAWKLERARSTPEVLAYGALQVGAVAYHSGVVPWWIGVTSIPLYQPQPPHQPYPPIPHMRSIPPYP